MTDQPRYFRISEGSLPITNSTADQVQFLIGGISLSAQFSWFMLIKVFRKFQLTIISMQNLFAALHDAGHINLHIDSISMQRQRTVPDTDPLKTVIFQVRILCFMAHFFIELIARHIFEHIILLRQDFFIFI